MDDSAPIVVVVDDSSTVRIFFERTVAPLGVRLHVFESAAESMEFLRRVKPALVFLDIIMPGQDGLTFLQELRRDPTHLDTPVVVISSKDYAQDRQIAKDLGVVEYVAKPMSKKTIRDLVVKYANAGGMLSARAGDTAAHE